MKNKFILLITFCFVLLCSKAYAFDTQFIKTYFLIEKEQTTNEQKKEVVYKEYWMGEKKWRKESLNKTLTAQIILDIFTPAYDFPIIYISNESKMYEIINKIREIEPFKIATIIGYLEDTAIKDFRNPLILKGEEIFYYTGQDAENLTQEIWFDEKIKLPIKIINKSANQITDTYFIYYNEKLSNLLLDPYIKSYEEVVVNKDFYVKKDAKTLNDKLITKGDKIKNIDKENPNLWLKKRNKVMFGTENYTLILEVQDKTTLKIKTCIIYQKDLIIH